MRAAIRLAALFALLLGRAAAGQSLLDRLLRNAETTEHVFSRSLESRSYMLSVDFTVLDGSGRSRTEQIERYRIQARHGEPARFILLSATRNGKDVFSQVSRRNQRARRAGGSRGSRPRVDEMADFSPFSESGRRRHRFALLPPAADGDYRVEIEPIEPVPQTNDPRDIRVRGEALFDRATERLESMTITPARMPPHLTELEVKRRFDPSTNLPESLCAEGTARFLLVFHRRFRVVTTWKFGG
jgi:hypothetical protein